MSQYPPGNRPARRTPSKQMMYRRRRAAVLGVLLLIVILMVAGISQCSSGNAAPVIPTVTPTQPVPTPTTSLIPNVGSTPGATQTPGAIAGVDTGYQGTEPVCTTKMLKVTAATDKSSYSSGQKPQLSMGVQNIGTTACKVNVGTNAQVFQISSNGQLIWQSTDCQTGALEYWALLTPKQTMNSAKPLEWAREKSSSDTCDAAARVPAPAGGATYYLTTFMGAAKSAQAKAFTLN
jgi:hypothetical protein